MLTNRGIFIFTLICIFGIFLYIPIVFQERQTFKLLKEELALSIKHNEVLKEEKEELLLQLDSSNDLYYIEKFARENLSMKKKNETVYRVVFKEDKK